MGDPKPTYIADYAVGDSIAFMFVEGNATKGVPPVTKHEDRYARIGIQSRDVLIRVQKLVDDAGGALSGKHIILSSGLSNIQIDKKPYADPKNYRKADFDSIEKQLETLQKSGAQITLLGVSNENPVFTDNKYNERLKALADKYGATFVPLPPTHAGDGYLHPAYKPLFAAVKSANAGNNGLSQLKHEDAAHAQQLMKKINPPGAEPSSQPVQAPATTPSNATHAPGKKQLAGQT